MSIQKNQEYIVDIIDNGFEGEGIAKIDNFTIFIPGTIKGGIISYPLFVFRDFPPFRVDENNNYNIC